jgi:predicted outer membrane repeat protein
VAMGWLLLMASGASAAERKCVVVNVGTGQSYGTLQGAVDAAATGDTLNVTGTCYGDTHVACEPVYVLTIVGHGHAILDGENSDQHPGTVFSIAGQGSCGNPDVTMTGLTITGGYYAGIGNYEASITLNDSTVTGNVGGGIVNGEGGGITLNNSTVTGNTTSGNGGGIATYRGGVATLNNSIVSGNSASGCGGGLFVEEPGNITLNDSSVTRNRAAGNGGGICDETTYGGEPQLTMTGTSSVSRNTAADNGGGIYNEGVVKLTDSASVTRNTASGEGGGIYNHETKGATIIYGTGWKGTVSDNLPDDIFNF